jgi:fucose 4-O-acetylase-like acetyltransferase
MPVFFILSGLFLAKTFEKYPTVVLIKKKAKTLLYPYLLWTTILITLQILLSKYTNAERTSKDYLYIFTQPRNLDHMWYLLALFNTSAFFVLTSRVFKKNQVLHVAFAVLLHVISFFIRDYSLFSDLFYYYIFLVAGFLISKRLLSLEDKNTAFIGKMLLLILPVFVAGQLFWLQQGQTETLGLLIPYLLIIFVACIFFYFLCRFLRNSGFALWLTQVGKCSLYIYILHILVISSFRILSVNILKIDNVYFLISGSLVLGVLLPILAYRVSSRWGLWYLFSLEKPKPS